MTKRILPLLLGLIVLLTTGGVYAAWMYSNGGMEPGLHLFQAELGVFDYTPEEVLPGGDNENRPEVGQDHLALIDLILSDLDYGLNYGSKKVLHDYLEDEGAVYSNQKVSGGNLRHLLNPTDNTHNMYYCLEKVSDAVYYAYTFSMNDLSHAGGTTTEIVAYRTTLEKTDKWYAITSHYGLAETKTLRALGVSADSNAIPYAIDMRTWHT